MSIFQALLLALFGWMSSIYSPVLMGGLGGWYTLGRPLVSGMVIGIILGDVQTGIIMGAAIQMLYIGLVTPGGAMPADVNFASWIGIPLAMVGGAGTEFALALAVPLSTLGVFAVYGLCAINLFFVHKQDAYIEKGEFDKAARIPIVGQITNIVLRFFPILIINYFGADLVTQLVNIMPLWLTDILQIFANMLPLVGFMLLMRTLVKKDLDLIYFVLGFILVSVANIGMIPIVIAALVIAYLKYQMSEKEA
ncbi:MAG: PTS sugar transporter subunit IIC [Lachnospiraceae bacterium]|jgi:mannose/fructose/N-acetylgalactosamine-specific phosphotransferase system component IIC|nr:PTS sugar transporter subunit IIC [Lachnospiraceae bacterium]